MLTCSAQARVRGGDFFVNKSWHDRAAFIEQAGQSLSGGICCGLIGEVFGGWSEQYIAVNSWCNQHALGGGRWHRQNHMLNK